MSHVSTWTTWDRNVTFYPPTGVVNAYPQVDYDTTKAEFEDTFAKIRHEQHIAWERAKKIKAMHEIKSRTQSR